MTMVRNYFVVAMTGLTFAALASPVLGQQAQQAEVSQERYAAIERCIRRAQAEWTPENVTSDSERMSLRTTTYRACMQAAGQQP